MAFTRYVPEWTGFPGGPGYTVLNFMGAKDASGATACATAVKGLFDAVASRIPTNTTINYPGEATIHSDAGVLTGAVPVSAPAATDCSGTGVYAAPVGVGITWETGSIVAGRRIKGRSFMVPTTVAQFDSDGSLIASAKTAWESAVAAFLSALAIGDHQLAVWSPTTSSVSAVLTATIPDKAVVLRSRRD